MTPAPSSPGPRDTSRASGRIAVRVPSDLHIALIQEAERQGVSLNLLIATVLAGAVGWQHPTTSDRGTDEPDAAKA
ncbi:MAG TPA: toxin-antitoxin system HicB family antitoxin [Solirubrobacteraceae bacterium]